MEDRKILKFAPTVDGIGVIYHEWQCNQCRHRRVDLTCKAFPNGIPQAIFNREHDHADPFPNDNGIQFETL